ncbi:protein of unknown function [Methylacidimicrobium sp. AP8]|nr:protein of unknown function [Methylacidimicrobium sp. AP8]
MSDELFYLNTGRGNKRFGSLLGRWQHRLRRRDRFRGGCGSGGGIRPGTGRATYRRPLFAVDGS